MRRVAGGVGWPGLKTLPLDPAKADSLPAFEAFLAGCRDEAAASGSARLVSVTLEVEHLDPLAVLESIYAPGELHFYCERPARDLAVAAADAVLALHPSGPNRFAETSAWIRRTLRDAIAVGDARLPFSGPQFFSAYSFFDGVGEDEVFPAGTVFVPRWQVARTAEACCAVANVLVEPESDPGALAARVWRARGKFRSFDYRAAGAAAGAVRVRRRSEVGTGRPFTDRVAAAVERIRQGEFSKIVLARAQDLEAEAPFHPLVMLNALRTRYPDCYAFSIGNGRGQSFIGATPERLVRLAGGEGLTEALAGSAPRGRSPSEDAGFGRELLASTKDRHEQQVVLESILRRLRSIGIAGRAPSRPRLRQLSNVQHLETPVSFGVAEEADLPGLVAALHPTPAVGGSPREAACAAIPELEPFARGLYAGPVGWINARLEGEFIVAIRSALVDGARARVFAGAGIVEDSRPEAEAAETDLKFRALLQAFESEPS